MQTIIMARASRIGQESDGLAKIPSELGGTGNLKSSIAVKVACQ